VRKRLLFTGKVTGCFAVNRRTVTFFYFVYRIKSEKNLQDSLFYANIEHNAVSGKDFDR